MSLIPLGVEASYPWGYEPPTPGGMSLLPLGVQAPYPWGCEPLTPRGIKHLSPRGHKLTLSFHHPSYAKDSSRTRRYFSAKAYIKEK